MALTQIFYDSVTGQLVTQNQDGMTTTVKTDFTQLDLAGEQPVSQKTTLTEIKRIGRENTFIHTVTGGAGIATHQNDDSSTEFEVSNNGDYVIQQTNQRFPYFSGKPIYFQNTYNSLAPQAGVIKRFGYATRTKIAPYNSGFDGMFFEVDENGASLQVWKNGTQVFNTPQSSWNIDKLDGAGPSGFNLDYDKGQIQGIEFLWLGYGPTQIAFEIEDRIIVVHREKNPNVLGSTYMKESNKPLFWEVRSTGGAGRGIFTCAVIFSRGSLNVFSIEQALSGQAESLSGNQWKPVVAIRLQDGLENIIPIVRNYATFCSSNANFSTKIFLCNANSSPVTPYVEVNGIPTDWDTLAFTNGKNFDYKNDFNNDFEIIADDDDGFAGSFGTNASDTSGASLGLAQYVGQEIDGSKDVLVLAINKNGGGSEDYQAILNIQYFQ